MVLLAFTLGWLSLLFVLARLGDSRPSWRRFSEHPVVYVMSLGVYATSWTFFGAVGFARTQGVSFIAVSLGPTLACLLIPAVFLPVLRLVRRHQLATVADLFAFRYRSQALGVAVTVAMLLGVLPYLAVQVRAVATTAVTLAPGLDGRAVGFAFCAVMLGFATLFGARHATTRERHPGLVVAIAFESLFKTLALLAAGAVAWSLDVTPSPERVEAFLEPARTGGFGSVLLLSVAATFLLPRQFHMAFTEAPEGERGERALTAATWGFPLLLLVLNLPIPLVLWAGEALAPQANGDLYVLLVAEKVPWLAPLVWLGGVSASSAMVIVASLALSSMSLTHLVLPLQAERTEGDVYSTLVRQRRVVVGLLLFATFLVFLALDAGAAAGAVRGGGLAQVGLVSFSAVLQLVPGLAGVLFFRRLSGVGVLSGLVAGLITWAVLLALPVVGFMGLQLPAWLAAGDPLGVSALLASTLNVVVTAVVSAWSPGSAAEQRAAQLCREEVESLAPGRRAASLEDLVSRAARVLGRAAARVEVERVTAELHVARETTDAAELQRVAERLEVNLTGLVGPMLAHAALSAEGDDEDVPLAARLQLLEAEARRGGAAAAQALREWLSNVFASLPVGVCVVSAEGEPVWWNASWTALSGVPTAQTLVGLPAQGEFTSGERTLNVSVASVTDERLPGGRVLVLEDLTARRALERTVAHQERLASIGRLGAGVAHEIGNPLAGLLMVAQNLSREEQPVDLKARLASIIEQGRRIDDIVKALVTFARREQQGARQPRPLFLDAVVRDAVALVTMTKKRRVEPSVEEGLGLRGVSGELVQVVVNLLSNAADASPPDAPVRLEARRVEGEVEVKVIDVGVGMTAEVQARLFEPFFTTKEPGQGTGLGMSIVYSLVSAHGGRITVDSAPGRGTCVTLRFPSLA